MSPFIYVNAKQVSQVPQLLGTAQAWDEAEIRIIAGGTDLLDELKERLIEPKKLINLKTVTGLGGIKEMSGNIRIGATTTLAEIESDPMLKMKLKTLTDAAHSVGSPQLRTVGTLAGNICQRPRCWYYRGLEFPCLKKGGNVCYAVGGNNKYHAIFGGQPSFIVHPSDCAPALVALDAKATIAGPSGNKTVDLARDTFFVLPQRNVRRENILRPNELITEIMIPVPKAGTKSTYVKMREKGSLDFALVSVAAVLNLTGQKINDARIVFGGVAPIPWRSMEAEAALKGKTASPEVFAAACEAAVKDARPMRDNGYKVTLTRVLLKRALGELTGVKV